MKVDLDKFYTPVSVAKKCIDLLDLSNYDTILEPSAGNGSFSKQIPNCIAYDLKPEDESIKQLDYFDLKELDGEHILVIGNPPFGSRSSLAKKFIEHSIELGAETIAFILPNTFNKYLMQRVFPKDWKLEKKLILDCDYKASGVKYFIPSTFFVWTKKAVSNDLRKAKPKETTDFVFLSRGDKAADFTINGNNGKIKSLAEVTNSKAEHYIKVSDKNKIEEVKERLKKIDFVFYSSINGKLAWLSQSDILEQYEESKNNQNKGNQTKNS